MVGKWDGRLLLLAGVVCVLAAFLSIGYAAFEEHEAHLERRAFSIDDRSAPGLLIAIDSKLEGSRFLTWAQLGATLICAAFLSEIVRKARTNETPAPVAMAAPAQQYPQQQHGQGHPAAWQPQQPRA